MLLKFFKKVILSLQSPSYTIKEFTQLHIFSFFSKF